jgi:hypothetical protein
MGLGNKKGHITGKSVSGGHTTVIDGADTVLKKMATRDWFISARPKEVIVDRGGKTSITIKRHVNTTYCNTLTLTFRKSATVQKIDVVTHGLDENCAGIVEDIRKITAKAMKGAEIYDRTQRNS